MQDGFEAIVKDRQARSIYRRLPVYGLDEVPRDSRENCQVFCNKFYGQLLKSSLYYQACIGVCASKLAGTVHKISLLLLYNIIVACSIMLYVYVIKWIYIN